MLGKIRWTSIIKIWVIPSYSLNSSNKTLHGKHTSNTLPTCFHEHLKVWKIKGRKGWERENRGRINYSCGLRHFADLLILNPQSSQLHTVSFKTIYFLTLFQPWSFYEGNGNTSQWAVMLVFWSAKHINRTNCFSVWQRFLYLKLIPGSEIEHFLSFKRTTFFESLIKSQNQFPRESGFW